MHPPHLTKYAMIAGALATPLVIAAPATANGHGPASAFGISANGLMNIPQTPVVYTSSRPVRKNLTELPANPLVHLRALNVDAAPGHARASVLDLHLTKAVLSASVITAKCESGNGSSELSNVVLAGHRLRASAHPNSALSIPVDRLGAVSVVINKQVRNGDGTLTVTGLELSLPLATGGGETISISSATCGEVNPPGKAPKPTPVHSDLPVTG